MNHNEKQSLISFDLLTVSSLLYQRRRAIGGWAGAAALVGIAIALLVKPYYLSTAILLPPQQQQSLSSMLSSQLPQLAGAGSLSSMGLKNPGDMYVGIMQGRTVSDWVITKLNLEDVFHQKLHSATIAALQRSVSFESSRDGLIRITAKANSPRLSADIANAYVDALYSMNSHLAVTEAGQRRIFFEQQVDGERKLLNASEEALKSNQQKTGMIQLSGQTELLLRQIANVRSEITSREVQISSLGTFETDQNPDVRQAQEELNSLRTQLAQLESKQRTASMADVGGVNSTGQVPQAGLEYLRLVRDVQYHESLFAALSKQYEAARLDEAKSAAVIQVVDHATPADRKAGPSRVLIVLISFLLGILVGALYYVCRAYVPGLKKVLNSAPAESV